MGVEIVLSDEPELNEGPVLDEIIPEIELDYLVSSRLISLATFPKDLISATKEFTGGLITGISELYGFYNGWINRSDNMIKKIYH